MVDKRKLDDLSIEELERVLAIKKREERQSRLKRMKQSGRVIEVQNPASQPAANAQTSQAMSDAAGLPAAAIEPGTEKAKPRKSVPQFEDAIDRSEYHKRNISAGAIWNTFVDRTLLLMEIGAVIGLIVLGFALTNGLNLLKRETAEAQALAEAQRRAGIPTIEPTPQLTLTNVVLPSGHTPPQNGVSNFNFAEVPKALQRQVSLQVFLPEDFARPPVTDDTPLRIGIPAIDIDHTIVQGVDWNALQQGVGMVSNGALPRNEGDNVVLAAHNDIYGEIFRDLDQLAAGDQITLQTQAGVYTYEVQETLIVEPDEVGVMERQGESLVTLISCYPYQVNTHRIVVQAKIVGT